jgi:hypothetical protein
MNGYKFINDTYSYTIAQESFGSISGSGFTFKELISNFFFLYSNAIVIIVH